MDEIQRQYQLAAEAQKEALKAQLQYKKDEALKAALTNKESNVSNLQQTQEQQTKQYDTQKVSANVSNEIASRNFAEYLANRGLSNSGAGVQADINRSGNLQNRLSGINYNENMMANEIAKKIQEANANYFKTQEQAGNLYNTELQSGINQIDSQTAENIAAYLRELNAQRIKAASKTSGSATFDNTKIPETTTPQEPVLTEQQQAERVSNFNNILGTVQNINSGAGAKAQKQQMIKNILKRQFESGALTVEEGDEIYRQLGFE